jgi:sporulation and spore germination protein
MNPRQLVIAVIVLLFASLGMALYAWRMQKHALATVPPAYSGSVAPPSSGATEQATLFVADDNSGELQPQQTSIPLPEDRQQRAEELVRALLNIYLGKNSSHPIAPGSDVRDAYLVDPGVAVIDMNSAFADGHRSGILVEDLTVASIVETVAQNIPGILRVKILVNGQERGTLAGHADLSILYDVPSAKQMVGQTADASQ